MPKVEASVTTAFAQIAEIVEDVKVSLEITIPGELPIEDLRIRLYTGFRSAGSLGMREYKKTTKTWNQAGTTARRGDGTTEDHPGPNDIFTFFNESGRPVPRMPTRPEMRAGRGEISMAVGSEDPRYIWIDRGTQEHTIKPGEEREFLVYRSGKQPKTQPGVLESGMGDDGSGNPFVKRREVRQSIRARGFTELVGEAMEAKLVEEIPRQIELALEGWVYKSNQAAKKRDIELGV